MVKFEFRILHQTILSTILYKFDIIFHNACRINIGGQSYKIVFWYGFLDFDDQLTWANLERNIVKKTVQLEVNSTTFPEITHHMFVVNSKYSRKLNPEIDDSTMFHFFKEFVKFEIDIQWSRYYMKQICKQTNIFCFWMRNESTFGIPIVDEDIIDLDSSNAAKFSHHLIFNNPVSWIQFLNNLLFQLGPNL